MTGRLVGDTSRPFGGWWTYRFGVTVVLFGFGIAFGPNRTVGDWQGWQRTWVPITVFRHSYFRGPFDA